MTTGLVHQLAALQRIAAFSVAVRGHELGEWRTGENFARASCIHCGAALRVYRPAAFEPEMDGPALEDACGAHAVAGRAA
jgi:hypothetical protein